ncbi:MAG: class I SAM-dependent methyltransferase [Candidatus Riflebacteria bacterium]|nr:class I SAM-dependent methyltransferase [Candidatus Riflebacteria bacterium]
MSPRNRTAERTPSDLDLESSVLRSMDGEDPRLFPFLPELLVDLEELGADPRLIMALLSDHGGLPGPGSRVLDLGCGKGAVPLRLAEQTECECLGLDAVPAFIETARRSAVSRGLEARCRFEVADIRRWDPGSSRFDLVLLGSIGPVLGPPEETLRRVRGLLAPGGRVAMDEVYARAGVAPRNPLYGSREALMSAIGSAGFVVVGEASATAEVQEAGHRSMLEAIRTRAEELSQRHPELRSVFEAYALAQDREVAVLSEDVVTVTLLVRDRAVPPAPVAPGPDRG